MSQEIGWKMLVFLYFYTRFIKITENDTFGK